MEQCSCVAGQLITFDILFWDDLIEEAANQLLTGRQGPLTQERADLVLRTEQAVCGRCLGVGLYQVVA